MPDLQIGQIFKTQYGVTRFRVIADSPNGAIWTKALDKPAQPVEHWTPDDLARHNIVVEDPPIAGPGASPRLIVGLAQEVS